MPIDATVGLRPLGRCELKACNPPPPVTPKPQGPIDVRVIRLPGMRDGAFVFDISLPSLSPEINTSWHGRFIDEQGAEIAGTEFTISSILPPIGRCRLPSTFTWVPSERVRLYPGKQP